MAKKVTPTEVLKEGTEDGIAKNTQRMSDSFIRQEIQKQLDPLQKELDKEKKITKVNKKNNTTQENLNKNIQKGIGTY